MLRGRNRAFEAHGIEVEARLLDVDEHRRGVDERNRLGRRREGESRTEHGVARADAFGEQREQQRVGSARDCDRVARAAERGELGLERGNFRAHHEPAMREHPRDRVIDAAAEPAALGGDVDEGNRRVLDSRVLVHAAAIRAPEDAAVTRRPAGRACAPRRARSRRGRRGTAWRYRDWRRLLPR